MAFHIAQVTEEHWVNQPPWDFPFQAFEVIRANALREEAEKMLIWMLMMVNDD